MADNSFLLEQQRAVERMREMNSKAKINGNTQYKMPPVPSFVKVSGNNTANENKNTPEPILPERETPRAVNQNKSESQGIFSDIKLPFLNNLLKDGDSTLIIGLLLILMSENFDKRLLFALIYILL